MRSRRTVQDEVAEVARRRLAQLSAELAEIRPDPVVPPPPAARDGSGEREPPQQTPLQTPPHQQSGPGRHAHRPVGLVASLGGWLRDRLPATLQGGVGFAPAHVVVVLALVLAAAGVTLWWVSRADGGSTVATARPVPAGGSPAALVTPTGTTIGPSALGTSPTATGSAAPGRAPRVVVDVAGKVRRPGIATLPTGSRVVDALKAAGGARRGVPLGTINLARVLVDGEQIVVGVPAPAGPAASAAAGDSGSGSSSTQATPMVNINTADQTQLEALPGIGPVTARSILDYRTERGTFSSVDELLEVSGIGDATLAKIAPYCTL